ncbi:MAG TPA: MgtC/SapB family protein [Acidimicrobiales bacterium]
MLAADTTLTLDADVVVRLLSAAVLGGLVGAEREASEQPAGLRTHIAVGLGAALFGIVSTLGFVEFDDRRANTVLQADVTRVASNVVVGIGFLGAGVIFRQGSSIRNLTTAASLWTVAAIGLACGVGDVGTAGIATLVLVASLVALRPIRTLIRKRLGGGAVEIRVELGRDQDAGRLVAELERLDGVDVEEVRIERADGATVVTARVRAGGDGGVRAVVTAASSVPGVESVSHS